ncbi:MAG: hypothetical protein KAT11_05570 [Phycisphaerae bacterium]|nr:hypothetical protein [Phycisphaerae bacterium]
MVITAASVDIRDFGEALTEKQARQIFRQGEEAVVFALLQLAKQLQQAQSTALAGPSTPSGMKPLYQKPSVLPFLIRAWQQRQQRKRRTRRLQEIHDAVYSHDRDRLAELLHRLRQTPRHLR